jgi:predicted PurR-regulated permease PerM
MRHPVVITFLIMAIVAAMSAAAEVLKPLALSVLLAFALMPLAGFFERRARLPRAAAVVLTVFLAMGTIGGISYVVFGQLELLARRLPRDEDRIEKKLKILRPDETSTFERAKRVANDVARKLNTSPVVSEGQESQVTDVRVVQQPTFRERLQGAVGPYLEFLGVGSFVLILVLFMLMNREDLRDRVVSLFGQSRVSLTTRTMDEIGQRISRYLATFAVVNSGFGLVVGLGLWAIGVEYAVLWGCLAAILRFIPYVGPAVAFGMPLVFSVAESEGWREPLLVVALFAVVETVLNSFLEPLIYGKTTGVSALGLLVAAMFWTWLWGLLGILLSTPMTVCLAVLGKYVPSLGAFATLLGEEPDLGPEVRFYQRLVALDRDGAVEVVEAALKTKPRAEVFDTILVPALSLAGRDAAGGHLEDQDLAFIWRVVEEIVDELEGSPEITLATVANGSTPAAEAVGDGAPVVLGVANDTADAVVLKMLAQLLGPSGLALEVAADAATPLELSERVAERDPGMVVLSDLPPGGLTSARYLVRRLRARFADLPILVGRWGAAGAAAASASERLTEAGASEVALGLAEARDRIVARLAPGPAAPESRPEPAGDLVDVGR